MITQKEVAIKIIRVDKIKDPYIKKNLQREAKIMTQLDHPNIISLHEVCAFQNIYCLVLDFWPGGSLCDYICQKEAGKLEEVQAQKLFKQILNGVEHIHSRNVVHRDIKLDNILINKAGDHVVIGDFGLSNFLLPGQLLRTHCGSPEYTAPEVILQSSRDFTKEVDIWSCGVVLYTMIAGRLPFTGPWKEKGKERLRAQISAGLTEKHYKHLGEVSEGCRSVLHQILSVGVDVRRRPRLHEIQLFSWCFSVSGPAAFSELSHQQQLEVAKRVKDKLNLINWSPDTILEYVQSSRGKLGKTAGCFSLMAADLRQQEVEAQPLRSPLRVSSPVNKPSPGQTPADGPLPLRFLTSNAARPEDFKTAERSARRSGGQENKPSTKMMKTYVLETRGNTPTPVRKFTLGQKTAPHYDRLTIFAQPRHTQASPENAVKEEVLADPGSAQARNIKKRRGSSSTFGHYGNQHQAGNKIRGNPANSVEPKPFKYLDKHSQF